MSVKGHGVDLVSIARIRKILEKEGNHFEHRVFSKGEIEYCRGKKDPYPYFAARFAAKEAYGKALGLGLGPSGDFNEIEVVHNSAGAPAIRVSGRAEEIFRDFGANHIFLSLSHEGDTAMASVILS